MSLVVETGAIPFINMKIRLLLCLVLSSVLLICNGLRVLGPSGALTAQPGGSVMLPCYVETPIPMEELEVEWRRIDSETVVHLFQNGESRPESQDQDYHERAHFFTEKVALGNVSLLLTDVTTKDAGVYKCVVYRNQESNETLIELNMKYLTVSGGRVVSAHVGEDTTLNCSVHSHIPPEQIEQLSWKKMDQDVVVLLIEKGQIKRESTHERYRDRVELSNPEEIHKGNFSLRLKNMRTEDKGLYVCGAFYKELSANTTVEVLQLGLSAIHKLDLFLCACVCLCGTSLLLVCIPWPCFKEDDHHIIKVQHGLVFCPNILMFLAFILWGQIDGFFSEVTVCSAVNLLRIIQLINFTPFINTLQGTKQWMIKKLTALECPLFAIIVYVVLWHFASSVENRTILTAVGITVLIMFAVFVLVIVVQAQVPSFLQVCLGYLYLIALGFLLGFSVMSMFFIIYLGVTAEDKLGLIFMNVLFFILTGLTFTILWFSAGSRKQQQQLGPFSRLCMCGVGILFLVNSLTLSAELILSARNGKRTIKNLQVIVLPFEWAVALSYSIALIVVEFSGQGEEAANQKAFRGSTTGPLDQEKEEQEVITLEVL